MALTRYLVSDFVDIQRQSFYSFLENGIIEEMNRRNPILIQLDQQNFVEIRFYPEHYTLMKPTLSVEKAIRLGKSYVSNLFIPVQITEYKSTSNLPASPLSATLGLSKTKNIRHFIKEHQNPLTLQLKRTCFQWITLGQLPIITKRGHFILNGSPRVIVNQIIRSPGIYYHEKEYKTFADQWTLKPKEILIRYYADLICFKGTWLRIAVDRKNRMWAQTKRHPKIPLLWLLVGMGLTLKQITVGVSNPERLLENFLVENKTLDNSTPLVETPPEAWKQIYKLIALSTTTQTSSTTSETVSDSLHKSEKSRGEDIQETSNSSVQNRSLHSSLDSEKPFELDNLLRIQPENRTASLDAGSSTNLVDLAKTTTIPHRERKKRNLQAVKQKMDSVEKGRQWVFNKFMNPRTYELSTQGRINFNKKLGLNIPLSQLTLTAQDLLAATDYLLQLEKGLTKTDDIDHLKNRRVRTVGELIQVQFGLGLIRLEKYVRTMFQTVPKTTLIESIFEPEKASQFQNPINAQFILPTKPVNGALREFFGTSPLSQLMDQMNPLAELTHKRRLTSLGPGGVTRDNATLEIRGIHPSHYGRICPIETPEGKNTGLVNSITTYARVNVFGIIETPYFRTYKGQVQKDAGVYYFTADNEEKITIAAGDIGLTPAYFLPKKNIPIRQGAKFTKINSANVNFMALSSIQMISVAASLIPFLEHDDANRALMGSNMQRQAVPLMRPTRPIVGTGLESKVVCDSGHALQTKYSGFVAHVSGNNIQIITIF